MFEILSWVLLAVYLTVHLLFCFFEKDKLRKITKCFCLVTMIIVCGTMGCNNLYVYLALIFGIIGDLFLLFKDSQKLLTIGMLAFGLNHIMYYVAILTTLPHKLDVVGYVLCALFYVGVAVGLYFAGRKYFKEMAIPSSLYSALLLEETLFSIIFLVQGVNAQYVLAALPLIGNLIFMVSDGYLAKTIFIKHDKREDFFIMLTYLTGQLLLAIGIGLL